MFEELGITELIDQATQQDPVMRLVTAGHAVKAMVLNGLGFLNQQLYLVPHFFQHKPLSRLIAPGIQACHLNDDTRGRTLDTLYTYGVTELYSLMAATAAKRLGLAPTFTHLDTTSFHVDGRYHSEEPSTDQVVHITHGYSRDHRPDLNQVMPELIVEHQAGIPVLMKPLCGNRSDAQEFGQVIRDRMAPLHTTYGATYLVADSALYSADTLQKLAETQLKWITRFPATLGGVPRKTPSTVRLFHGRTKANATTISWPFTAAPRPCGIATRPCVSGPFSACTLAVECTPLPGHCRSNARW
jgi:transposase